MRLLDLFCCEGGASTGYAQAGFEVVGVDIAPQPRYPFKFVQDDALMYFMTSREDFDAVHASPPCQAHTRAQKIRGNEHPDLVEDTRSFLAAWGGPYVIENVPGAPLVDPVELCGSMFGLGTYRHRLFETNWGLTVPEHPKHVARTTKMGRAPVEGEYMHIVGNFSGVDKGREVMEMPWASRDGLREAIPPAYTRWIGAQLMEQINHRRAA